AGATMPLLFAVFGAAVPGYGARYNVLFGFLLLVSAALAVIARFREPRWLHLVGGAATVAVLVIWSAVSYNGNAWPAVVAWVAVFTIVQLAASWGSEVSMAPGVLLMFPILAGLEPRAASPWLLFGTLFVLPALIAAYALRHSAGLVYFLSALLALFAEGMWSARYLAPERLVAALILYAVFALFFVGVPVLARRLGRELGPPAATPVVLLLAVALLLTFSFGPAAKLALWGLAVLLAITNAGVMVEARAKANPLLSAIGALVSWILIGAAAIYLKRGGLMIAALAASQLVLIAWAFTIESAPWPLVALVATLSVAALGVVWDRIDRRFAPAAVASLFLGHVVAMTAG